MKDGYSTISRYEAVANLAKIEKNKSILDCSCGEGRKGNNSILDKFDPARYVCVDIDKKAIEKCKKNTNNRADEYICADLCKLILNEQFDYCFCVETLEHLKEKDNQKASKAISNLIKGGGKLLITIPGNEKNAMKNPGHKQIITKKKLLSLYDNFELEAEAEHITRKGHSSLYIFKKEIEK